MAAHPVPFGHPVRRSLLAEAEREFFADHTARLTVVQLPSYASDLNPQEGVWPLVKRELGNLAATDLDQITGAIKRKLKTLQYRPTCSTAASPVPASPSTPADRHHTPRFKAARIGLLPPAPT
ncbi:transposase [Streptomyces sp. NPDC096057]|uniref:transposase n=1 Tax=Streptomyces sp. NPDC096057 TaxID=3155543 RepID=UPI00331CB888